MVVISNNYVDASFSSDNYLKQINNKELNNNSASSFLDIGGRN